MNKTAHIIVVDDEPEVCELIEGYLTGEGFEVSVAYDAAGLQAHLARGTPDLVILDLGLPGEDGLTVTRHLREASNVGILILTGKGETVDRIVGLEMGADDYMTKPFDLRELLARTKSILRRAGRDAGVEDAGAAAAALEFAGWLLFPERRVLVGPNGAEVELTPGEFGLLNAFTEHPNRVLSRDQLLDMTRHRPAGPFDRSIDVQVGRLRRKIEHDPEHPSIIKTVRGAGYVFTPAIRRA